MDNNTGFNAGINDDSFIHFTKKLQTGKSVFGLVILQPVIAFAEVIALAGYDFCWIDMEHSAMNFHDVEKLILALEVHGCVPLVRIRSNDYNAIGQVLDMGARIVAVPHVDTAEEAREAVKGAKYYPLGRRGYATDTRSTSQGYMKLDTDSMNIKNKETKLMVLIESEEAVRNVDEIANVDGVDVLFVGCADLSQDMGITPDFSNPRLLEAVRTVGRAIETSGKIGAFYISDPDKIKQYRELGFNMYMCGSETMLLKKATEELLERLKTGE